MTTDVVRIGFTVTREDSEWIPFEYRMFYCRQREVPKDPRYCPVADWAREEVSLFPEHGMNKRFKKMKIGETRRYWAQVKISSSCDYWGEWDTDAEILQLKRAK